MTTNFSPSKNPLTCPGGLQGTTVCWHVFFNNNKSLWPVANRIKLLLSLLMNALRPTMIFRIPLTICQTSCRPSGLIEYGNIIIRVLSLTWRLCEVGWYDTLLPGFSDTLDQEWTSGCFGLRDQARWMHQVLRVEVTQVTARKFRGTESQKMVVLWKS